VRYAEVAAAKHEMLILLWRHFQQRELASGGARGSQFARFLRAHADTLGRHALYEAIQCHLHAADPTVWGWPAWPEDLRDPRGAAVQRFAQEHADAVQYRAWLQWIAHEQLAQAS